MDLYSFLRSLDDKQRKELIPGIKKLTKKYNEWGTKEDPNRGYMIGTQKQRELLQCASFVCFNRTDYSKTPYTVWFLNKETLGKVLDWYCPDWFSDYFNEVGSNSTSFYNYGYDWVMELSDRGFLKPGDTL